MPTLQEITEQLTALTDILDSLGDLDNVPVELQQQAQELLAEKQATHELEVQKLNNYCWQINHLIHLGEMRKQQGESLLKSGQTLINTAQTLKKVLKKHLEATGKDEKTLHTAHFSIRVCTNGGKDKIEVIESKLPAGKIPVRFRKPVVIEPDTDKILEAIKSGEPLEWAEIKPRESHVRISPR